MSVSDDLLALEKRFWTGTAEFYRDNLDERCLTAFAQMAGVFEKDDIARSVGESARWRDVDISPKGVVEPAENFAVLTYQASATREDGGRYDALVSSGYVKRGDAWKLAFHQQTPLAPPGEATGG